MMESFRLTVFLLTCLVIIGDLIIQPYGAEIVPIYQFKRYSYKKKQKNERKIKHLKAKCDDTCVGQFGLAETICYRRCMSEHCFTQIYQEDPLEQGEIDVRYSSFKGCIISTRHDI